jgi:hypothetical protein
LTFRSTGNDSINSRASLKICGLGVMVEIFYDRIG